MPARWLLVFGLGLAFWAAPVIATAQDADGDGIPDVIDKCTIDSRNGATDTWITIAGVPTLLTSCDSDCDGFGNVCDADFNQNGATNVQDLNIFNSATPPAATDMNCNTTPADAVDWVQYFVPKFKGSLGGNVPGPSGYPGTTPCY